MNIDKGMGCYIHIPFCNTICSYCDFCKLFYKEDLVDKYLEELDREIEASYDGKVVDTLYIGGGTPSSLTCTQLEKLLEILKSRIKLSKVFEYTIECNFDSVTFEKLDIMKRYGINRISFGLESIDSDNLVLLNRTVDIDKVKKIIDYCHKIHIDNINIDLIYALPNETLEVVKKDVDFIKSLDITHISTYSLILEEHTKLKISGLTNIEEDLDAKMYELIEKELSDFDHYEISNFARKEEYKSKHNIKYWKNMEYYGFGLASSGYEGSVRYSKTRSITKYLNGDYMKEDGIEYLTTKDKINYEVILNLRTEEGISLEEFRKKYGKDFSTYYDYTVLIKNNLLELENNHLFIPKRLWYISNGVILKLLENEVEG